MVTAVILPLSSDYSEAKTFTNKGYFRMSELPSDENHTITWSYEDPTTLSIDSVDVELDPSLFPSGTNRSVIISDSFLIRLFGHGTYYTLELWDKGYVDSVSSADSDTLSISISSNTLTWTANEETPVSRSFTDYVIAVDNSGDMIMKGASDLAYMMPDSVLYAAGISTFKTNVFGGIYITGTIENVSIDAPLTGVTVNNDTEIVTSEVSGYIDLVQLDKITFSTTYDGSTVNQTYSYFVVPYEVSADPDNPAAYKSLVMVIPLMSFVVLVVAAAAMIYLKKD